MKPGKSSGDDRTLVGDIAEMAFEPRFTESEGSSRVAVWCKYAAGGCCTALKWGGSPAGEIVKKPVCWATGETPQARDRGTMDGRNKQITMAC